MAVMSLMDDMDVMGVSCTSFKMEGDLQDMVNVALGFDDAIGAMAVLVLMGGNVAASSRRPQLLLLPDAPA